MAEVVDIFSVRISKIDFDGVCREIEQRIASREPGLVTTPNVNLVCSYHRNAEFRRAYRRAFLWLPDGTPLMWSARLAGKPLGEKLSGSDMVPRLAEFAARKGYSIFLFGALGDSAEIAAKKLRERFPDLNIAGVYQPPLGFHQDPAANAAAIDVVRQANPDICFVALGSPKQEIWISEHLDELGVPVAMGVGAAIDFLSGKLRRAPGWAQNWGMEWLWRLLHEPRRLWRRYLVEDMIFVRILFRELIGRPYRYESSESSHDSSG